jgi:hypothetical protein
MAKRRKRVERGAIEGARIRVRCNGMKWSGQDVPMGTVGTVYIHQGRYRAVQWDGLPQLQRNGFPFGIGGDASKDFVPDWAELIEAAGWRCRACGGRNCVDCPMSGR